MKATNGLEQFAALDKDKLNDDMRQMATIIYERVIKDTLGTPIDKVTALGALSLCAGVILAQILVQKDNQEASDAALRHWMSVLLTNAVSDTREETSRTVGLH
jgi:hypothetical protein